MSARGDEIGDRTTGVTAGDQPLTHEHRIGACACICQQVGGAADTGFGHPDDVGRQARCDPREAVAKILDELCD